MTPLEASEIITKFHNSIRDLRPNAIVQSSEKLPYTPARIKYAHFVYGEHFIKDGFYVEAKTKKTKEEIAESCEKMMREMTESYGIIDSFFSEESELVNIKYKEYLEELKNGTITDFQMPNPFGEINPVLEFHNFLGECWFFEHKTNLFKDSQLGSFIYDGVRNKATKEKDINTLKDMVNSSLTREVDFPGKRDNEGSIFIQ